MSTTTQASSRPAKKPIYKHPVMIISRYIGSLKVAVVLIVILAAVLIAGTFFESFKTTELAQRVIYTSWWFDLYLTLFALNVFCAVVTRYPFQKRHIGFIITHAGLLIICLGSGLNRHLGIEGQMYLVEGQAANDITLADRILEVRLPSGSAFEVPADMGKVKSVIGKPLRLGESGYALTFLEAGEGMRPHTEVFATEEGERNPAIRFELKSEMAGFHQEEWLIYFDETNPTSATWSLGPATFRIFKALSDEESKNLLKSSGAGQAKNDGPQITVAFPNEKNPIRFSVNPEKLGSFKLPSINATLHVVEYLPQARVVNNKLVNEAEASPNPAVRLEIRGPDGKVEKHTAFALFPEFDTLHGSGEGSWSGVKIGLEVPSATDKQPKAEFSFVQDVDGTLRYASETARGGYTSGNVELNSWQDAGWMDFQFQVKEYFPRAGIKRSFVTGREGSEAAMGTEPLLGVRVNIAPATQTQLSDEAPSTWVAFGSEEEFTTEAGAAHLVYRYRAAPVPFSIKLVDFRRIFYPGTRNPAAYESDVVLFDRAEGLTREQKIYMNHPLDHKGFRVFQSSFVEVPAGEPEISIFQVAKAPGTPIIYAGAIILIAGIVTMFYIKRYSSAYLPKPVSAQREPKR